jgi:hypothetical protein
MAVNLSPIGGVAAQFFDNSGNVLSGGKIFTYAAGTTTPQATYTSAAGVTPLANPILLDAAGRVPTGEIWLTDGLQYKFIIKTSTDVQIGSYDNIVGINSNFVNYTNSQEFQTATAGQTVFTLTTMQYQPGTNSLSVFVDGVNQYGPGASYAYQETSSTVVTFTSGLHVGADVKFTTSAINSSSAGDAEQVSYTPPFTNSVATNVEVKLGQYVSVKDFGAVGDGVTDDAAAVQNAVNYVQTLGGNLYFPKGVYLFGSQVTINRTYAPDGSNFVGERNLIVSGYGAEIRTTGAITAFNVRGGWAPNLTCLIEGFTIYHRGNTTAVGGIRLIGAGLCTCRDITVVVSSLLPVGYAAFSCENLDPANDDTGCFWNYFDNCAIRPWAGAEGNCTYGLKLMGPANATTVRNIKFGGSDTHVILMAHPGYTSAPNAVNIDGNFFEGPVTSTAISLVSSSSPYHVSGTRITNNRFESLNTAVSLTGLGSTVQLPTYMSGNYADTAVTNYIVNASNIPIVMLDASLVGAPMGPMITHNQQGVVLRNDDGSFDSLTLRTPSLNRGVVLQTYDGTDVGSWRYRNAMGGSGTLIGGTYSTYRPFGIVACQGISIRDTPANNLAGVASFVASTTVNVTLPVAEVNANYSVFLENIGNRTLWVTSKTTTGFTINASASSSDSAAWLLIRTGA